MKLQAKQERKTRKRRNNFPFHYFTCSYFTDYLCSYKGYALFRRVYFGIVISFISVWGLVILVKKLQQQVYYYLDFLTLLSVSLCYTSLYFCVLHPYKYLALGERNLPSYKTHFIKIEMASCVWWVPYPSQHISMYL